MTREAAGPFDVKIVPVRDDGPIGRMSLAKTFSGDLAGSSEGQMLVFMAEVKGSAGYVAMERITGTLNGRQGSFVVQHLGLMDRGAESLTVVVIPDSGTDGLTGISGTMDIKVDGGAHSYLLRYTLPG
ncbi:MAG: DUF3224 domain-containing protein [Gemmatimonadota bacterium]|nr:DUF3224 domain-containing protein [Gemmatimonadota bacterium]